MLGNFVQWLVACLLYNAPFLDNGKMLVSASFNTGARYTWSLFRHDFELYISDKDIKFYCLLNFWLFEFLWCSKLELYFISSSYGFVNIIEILEQGSKIIKVLLLLQRSGKNNLLKTYLEKLCYLTSVKEEGIKPESTFP